MRKNRSSVGKIDSMEWGMYLFLTVVYAIFIGIISGVSEYYLPTYIFLWKVVPLKITTSTYIFGIALWSIITLFLNVHYKRT